MRHEPLRAACIFARQSHTDRRMLKWNFVDFAANLIAGPAILIAARIAGLNYKVGHHARNCLAVKVASLGELNKVVDSQRRVRGQEFDRERAFAGRSEEHTS